MGLLTQCVTMQEIHCRNNKQTKKRARRRHISNEKFGLNILSHFWDRPNILNFFRSQPKYSISRIRQIGNRQVDTDCIHAHCRLVDPKACVVKRSNLPISGHVHRGYHFQHIEHEMHPLSCMSSLAHASPGPSSNTFH